MNAFKAYDIRGVYQKDFNLADVYKIGFFLPQLLNATKVLVGRDIRLSSDEIFNALASGITDAGADVFDAGLTTTPMVYWATAKFEFTASVQITASHNPAEYNGMKISRQGALPVGYDTGLKDLEDMVKCAEVYPASEKGMIHRFEFQNDYLAFISQYRRDFSNLRIAVDCSNGMASLFAREILGKDAVYIFDTPDGRFPNHAPNPLEIENVHDLMRTVTSQHCDLGIIFDGDADRVMFVDETGSFIRPDIMIGMLGLYFAKQSDLGNVVMDIRSSKGVEDYLGRLGFRCHLWKVGRAFAALKLRDVGAVFGGELAGHYYFRDFYYSDSAFLAVMLLLQVISDARKEGIALSELVRLVAGPWYNSGEINFKSQNKKQAMEVLVEHYSGIEAPAVMLDFDGYRLEFKHWWFNVRPSNTESYLRLLIEADSETILKEKTEEITEIIMRIG
ncbi:MAG TPA: phosphomannomutase/phosphoglucomutase [Bacteroidales bacterium]|nr:phosphomannomutase/phosphoglucomutase [Bacteroidales bacterium]